MTLLNEADAVYAGAVAADAVYLGAEKVWPTVFDPIALGGLTVWLDASQLALANGAAVSPWPDISGQNNHGSIVGAPAPTLRTNALNGKAVVRFNPGQGRVRGNSGIMSSGVSVPSHNFSILYVTRMVGPTVGRIFSGTYPTTNFLVGYHSSLQDTVYDGAFLGGTSWGATPTSWCQFGYTGSHNGAVYATAFYKNGGTIATSTTCTNGLNNGYNFSGYDATGAEETCDAEVAELLIYNHKLPDAERVQVETYLRAKWGLP